jgi:preprotein translocase subunit SecG
MALFTFLLIVQTLVAITMISVILMQRSEGGGLAGGGSPAGMMSARGAADFLTRSTAILATVFVALSIVLAGIAAGQRGAPAIDPTLASPPPAGAPEMQQSSPFDVVPGAAPAEQAPQPQAPAGDQGDAPPAQ